jgi:hypothetical protein
MKKRKILALFGVAYIIGLAVCMLIIWFVTFFFSDGIIWVNINWCFEMYPELVLHIIGLSCCALWLYDYIKNKGVEP